MTTGTVHINGQDHDVGIADYFDTAELLYGPDTQCPCGCDKFTLRGYGVDYALRCSVCGKEYGVTPDWDDTDWFDPIEDDE